MFRFKVPSKPFQSQVKYLSGYCGGKIIYADIKEEGDQDRFLRDAVSHTLKSASLAVTGGEGEAFVLNKLQDHPNHVLIPEKYQPIAGEVAMLNSAKSRCQVEKHGSDLLFVSKESSIFCLSKTVWATVDLPCQNPACSLGSCGSIKVSTRV